MARDFWRHSGFHLLRRDASGRLVVSDDFLRAYYLRPEARPVGESCANEIALHAALMDALPHPAWLVQGGALIWANQAWLTAAMMAQILLAWEPPEAVMPLLPRCKFTGRTLAEVRRRGWAQSVAEREPGVAQSFESVQGAVAMTLRQQTYVTALRQYLSLLAGAATVEGVDLDAAETPLVQ